MADSRLLLRGAHVTPRAPGAARDSDAGAMASAEHEHERERKRKQPEAVAGGGDAAAADEGDEEERWVGPLPGEAAQAKKRRGKGTSGALPRVGSGAVRSPPGPAGRERPRGEGSWRKPVFWVGVSCVE